jgi:hypothetical protein
MLMAAPRGPLFLPSSFSDSEQAKGGWKQGPVVKSPVEKFLL